MELDRLGRPHRCHAAGCEVAVPRKMFMCRTHWFRLPKAKRDAIWRHYQPDQETGRVDPTPEYFAVAQDAIRWLANQDRARG